METAHEMVGYRIRRGRRCTLKDILQCQTYGAGGKPLKGMLLIAHNMGNFKVSESRAVGEGRIASNRVMFSEAVKISIPLSQAQQGPVLPGDVAARTSLEKKSRPLVRHRRSAPRQSLCSVTKGKSY